MIIVSFNPISLHLQLFQIHGFFNFLTLLLGVFIFCTITDEPLEVQDLKSIVKFCNDFSTLDIEQVRRLVAERDDHTKQVEKSQLQMKELKDELERVTAEKDALKDELERVIAAKDALLTAQSAANGADELNAVTRKEFDDLSKQLAEMNEKISSLETIIRNDMEEVEQTVFVKTVDIEEELKQLGASIDATYKLRDEG